MKKANIIRRFVAKLFHLEIMDNVHPDVTMTIKAEAEREMEELYLYDFLNYEGDHNFRGNPVPAQGAFFGSQPEVTGNPKIIVSPKSVVNELETVPTMISLVGIDQKISLLKKKSAMIKQFYAKRDVVGLIERLQNRGKYPEHKTFFEGFPNTTDEKIKPFLVKHSLILQPADMFIPEFPKEAVDIMEKYTSECETICSKKPVFYVIATEDNFRDITKKRDPILLVQSPFGFYWQILGAWDEEMLILGEL